MNVAGNILGFSTLTRKLFQSTLLIAVVGTGILLTSGCTNNLNISTTLKLTTTTLTNSGDSSSNIGVTSATYPLTVNRVIKDTFNPDTVLDLLGDGTGAFGSLCTTNSGSNNCTCTFAYSSPSHPNQKVNSPILYTEANMMRCSYSLIPSGVTSVAVSIYVSNLNSYSNSINFNLSGTAVNADTSNANLFAKVNRYQCSDILNIPYMFDGGVYDPIQSEDFHLTYPLDFYTTNLGGTISLYGGSSSSSLSYWNCPSILNPQDYLNPTAYNRFKSTNHINMKIYSKAPLNGSISIYPSTPGAGDRSTFYLAKKEIGLFNVPVNSYVAPNLISSNGKIPAIGYGVRPIPTSVGKETCPDPNDTSVKIPAGFKWAKLWLFRASLKERHYAGSSSLNQLQNNISCNPGDYQDSQTLNWAPVYAGCYLQKSHANGGTYSISMDKADLNANFLADRVLGTGQCVRLFDSNNSQQYCTNGSVWRAGPSCFPIDNDSPNSTTDLWQIQNPPLAQSRGIGCFASTKVDPLNLCDYNESTATVPFTRNITAISLDAPVGSSGTVTTRYDFLFVVTPPSVSTSDMQNSSPSSPSLPYQPYRFYTDEDCLSDPSAPNTKDDCHSSNMINNYGLKLHDVGTLGDPPGNDPNRAGVFPVCILQPSS